MDKKVVVVLAFVALSGLFRPLCAGTIYVEKIATTYTMATPTSNKWYDYNNPVAGQGQINFAAMDIASGSGLINTHPAENPLYQFALEGKFTFLTPLAYDSSSGGRANGYFAGGAAVVLSGGIKFGGVFIYGGTGAAAKQIFQAQMNVLNEDPLNPTLNRWKLQEDQYSNGKFEKSLNLTLTPGSTGLASGISLNIGGESIVLKMLDPKMDLSLKALIATNFLNDIGPASLPSNVTFTAPAPEPATLVLLAIGGLCLGVRRK